MSGYIVSVSVHVDANTSENARKLFWEDPRWYFTEAEIDVVEEG